MLEALRTFIAALVFCAVIYGVTYAAFYFTPGYAF